MEDVIKAIEEGNLNEIMAVFSRRLGAAGEVDKPLCAKIRVKCPSRKCPFTTIAQPSALVLAILSEQHLVLQYILQHFKPSLSQRINGWAPIHYACCTGNYGCLRVLLDYPYTQENIDLPIIEPLKVSPGMFSTALHVAVTNGRHAQAIILTQDLPCQDWQPANAELLSAYGNAPLHIAAYNKDWDMCQILMNASDDWLIKNSNSQTPIDIAKKRRFADLAAKLQEGNILPIADLKRKYITDVFQSPNLNIDEENDDRKILELTNTITDLADEVQQLRKRLSDLEQKGTAAH